MTVTPNPETATAGGTAALAWSTTTSADGTRIAFASLGSGPGVVIAHGSMQSAATNLDLARLLADRSTVHLVDRRGRGRSADGPSGTEREADDLVAVLDATGARSVLGISSGALIAMRAGLRPSRLDRIALFEPALVVDGSLPLAPLDRFDREYAAGDMPAYLVTAMLAAEMGPAVLAKIPRPILRRLTGSMLRSTARKQTGDVPTMVDLAPALRHDFTVVREQAERLDDFAALSASVLLLCGTRTRPYLRAAVDALSRTLPAARRVDLPGLDHGATGNRSDRGRPDAVAEPLREFLAR